MRSLLVYPFMLQNLILVGQHLGGCDDQVLVYTSGLHEFVLDTGWEKHVLRPNDAKRTLRKDEVGYVYVLPDDPSHLLLRLDEIHGAVHVFLDDSLVFDGISNTGRFKPLDLGLRFGVLEKRLRIETGQRCMTVIIAEDYPILEVGRSNRYWYLNYTDHWRSYMIE